jgi:uncharacterized protein (DUF2141 family)
MRTALGMALVLAGWAGTAAAADLSLTIEGARSSRGTVAICLWSDSAGFPDCGASRTAQRRTVAAGTLGQPIVFKGLKPGTFAISALHDENGNGRLDTNFLGIPKEGIAVSNDALPKFSAPRFADTAFPLNGSAGRRITLFYR